MSLPVMTRYDLATEISLRHGISVNEARKRVAQVLNTMTDFLAGGNNLRLQDFGTLKVVRRKAKTGRNFSNPEAGCVIPPRTTIRYVPGKAIFQKLNPVPAQSDV